MGKIIQKKVVPISESGSSLYLLLDAFAKEFLTGTQDIGRDTHEAHIDFSVSKTGDHYAAVWLEKKKVE